MKKSEIPQDWVLWIEIAQDHFAMDLAVLEAEKTSKEAAELVGLCLSAAKWITGCPEDLGIKSGDRCGVCRVWCCSRCIMGHGDRVCIPNARDGLAMRLYAGRLAKWDRKHA